MECSWALSVIFLKDLVFIWSEIFFNCPVRHKGFVLIVDEGRDNDTRQSIAFLIVRLDQLNRNIHQVSLLEVIG